MAYYDPDETYATTDLPTMTKWLEACESATTVPVTNGGVQFNEREREFITSVRIQFDNRRLRGSDKPLSGKQLAWLRAIYDRT